MISIIGSLEVWGIIPGFLDENDLRPAQEQINERYIGGWMDAPEGLKLDLTRKVLTYKGDPDSQLLGLLHFRNELLMMFEHEWVCILQKDASYRIARLD